MGPDCISSAYSEGSEVGCVCVCVGGGTSYFKIIVGLDLCCVKVQVKSCAW